MTRALKMVFPLLALAACAQLQTVNPQPQSDWDRALYYARRDVEAGNYFAADKLLDEFVRTHPNTPEAREIGFWKAAYLIDPANERGSLATGIAALDAYLAADSAGRYRTEATVLRRTAAVAGGIPTSGKTGAADSSATSSVKDTIVVVRSRDEQIASLKDQLAKSKDELAKVSAELDRIKKRLANPSN
ncbi:MAG: hypothetical protein PVSMB1_12640 [Gemmatimonadaceae bacterium]